MATEQYTVKKKHPGSGVLTLDVEPLNDPSTKVTQITVVDNSGGGVALPSGAGLDYVVWKQAIVYANAVLFSAVSSRVGEFTVEYDTDGLFPIENVSHFTCY